MRQRLEVVAAVLVVIVLLAVLAWAVPQWLAPLPTPAPGASPTPALAAPTVPAGTPSAEETRAILVSLAGMRPDLLEQYVQQGQMPYLAQLGAGGASAEYAQAIYPPLGASSHAAIASGAYANVTGVVADEFHTPGTPIDQTWSGYNTVLPVEPLWATAAQQGRSAATICWPGSLVDTPANRADYVVAPGIRDVESNLHQLYFTRVMTESTAWTGLPLSFSPCLESQFPIIEAGETKYPVYALLIDSTADEQVNYDTLLLDLDRAINERTPRGQFDEWLPLETDPFVHAGAYFKVMSSDPADFRVYQSAICYNAAAPTDLLRALNAQVGFFPADPDLTALQRDWITAGDYLAMLDRQCQWIVDAALYVDSVYHPDLLLVWQASPAAAERALLLVDENQPGYTPARAREYATHIQQAYHQVDAQVGRLAAAADPAHTTLFVFADQGLAPVHTTVHVNKALADRGLLILDPATNRVDPAQTQALAVTGGGTVHVYVNLENRETGGIVAEEAYPLVCEDIIATLRDVRDAAGAPVFPLIVRRADAARIHLDHPHSGDVIAFAAPGYVPSAALGRAQLFESAEVLGQNGYDAVQPTMHAILLASGYGVRPGVFLAPVSALDIVPTVARILRLRPAAHWQGQVLTDMIER